MKRHRILIVDDKDTMRSLFQRILPEHDVITAADGAQALVHLEDEESVSLVVSDIRMPRLDGLTLLREVRSRYPETEVILMTAFAEVSDAVDAMKAGAFDYLVKPFDPDEAVLAVEKALEVQDLRNQARILQKDLDHARGFGPFVGTSAPMQRIYRLVDKAAACEVNVLVTGSSGTGKELVARSIHERSGRRSGPFVTVNCGALPLELAESELLGHARGAFTGAVAGKPGLVQEAAGGTLFLDEINSLPPTLQVKLNRAIEEREGRRVGSTKNYAIDARFISATNADLQEEAKEGRFREDLYFRINVLHIQLPDLGEHREDVPLLAAHFLERATSGRAPRHLAPDALKALLGHSWPGNIRELRNAVESAVAVAEGEEIIAADLPHQVTGPATAEVPTEYLASLTYKEACDLARERMLRRYFEALMRAHTGSVTAAAKRAGISRETLHRLLRRHSVTPADYRA